MSSSGSSLTSVLSSILSYIRSPSISESVSDNLIGLLAGKGAKRRLQSRRRNHSRTSSSTTDGSLLSGTSSGTHSNHSRNASVSSSISERYPGCIDGFSHPVIIPVVRDRPVAHSPQPILEPVFEAALAQERARVQALPEGPLATFQRGKARAVVMPHTPAGRVGYVGVAHNVPPRFERFDLVQPYQCPEYYRMIMYNPLAIVPAKMTDLMGADHPGYIDTTIVQTLHPQYFRKLPKALYPEVRRQRLLYLRSQRTAHEQPADKAMKQREELARGWEQRAIFQSRRHHRYSESGRRLD